MSRRTSLAPSSISTSRQSSLAYKGCSEPMNDAALQFKLSKKVAELTLVVHMLFTRNHEREVELEVTKEAYEEEIDHVSAEFEKKIAQLKKEIEAERAVRKSELEKRSKAGEEQARKLIDKHAKKISELTSENESLKSNMRAMEERNKRLAEDLARAEREQGALDKERMAKERAMEKDQQRIEKLQQNARANKEMMDKLKDNIHSIQRGVNQKISQMEASSRSANEIAEQLRLQNDQLESENKGLKKRVTDQAAQLKKFESGLVSNGQGHSTQGSNPKAKSSTKTSDKDDSRDTELEALRREVQKYRLELKNREENFNKIFSEIKPIMVTSGDGGDCVKEIRDDPEKTEEIPVIYAYKQTLAAAAKSRKVQASRARSKLPSLSSSADRGVSTRGGPGKYSPPSDDTLQTSAVQLPPASAGTAPPSSALSFKSRHKTIRPIKKAAAGAQSALPKRPYSHQPINNTSATDVRWSAWLLNEKLS